MNDYGPYPLLRLELQEMRHTLLIHLQERHTDLEKMIGHAFDNALGHIKAQLDTQVQAALSRVISDAVTQAAESATEGLALESLKERRPSGDLPCPLWALLSATAILSCSLTYLAMRLF